MRDLDLLFRASDLARAARLIEDHGYRLEKRLPVELAALAPEFGHHVSASAAAIGVRLELHFCLLVPHGPRRVDLDCVLPRLRRVPFMGMQVPALPAGTSSHICASMAETMRGVGWSGSRRLPSLVAPIFTVTGTM